MDKWPKDKFIAEIARLEEQVKYYQTKLRDLVRAYKSLVAEKTALESSIKVARNVSNPSDTAVSQETQRVAASSSAKEKTLEQRTENRPEIATLMNSLSVLSAEKCRMEASFQADKKTLRQEKEKNESYIRELEDRLKKLTYETTKEIENLKSKLIIARHDREKELNDHSVMMRELQRLLSQEREEKETLEKSLAELRPKLDMLLNKEEVDRYKETDISEKLLNIQKKHLSMLEAERRRVLQAENESKEQIAMHERRVASLESRVTELSHTVANYHRLRQLDQNQITKLKAHIDELDNQTTQTQTSDPSKEKDEAELKNHLQVWLEEMRRYKTLIHEANKKCDKPVDIHTLICEPHSHDSANDSKHDEDFVSSLQTELERVTQERERQRELCALIPAKEAELESLKVQVQALRDENVALNNQLESSVLRCQTQTDSHKTQIQMLNSKHDEEVKSVRAALKSQILELEGQLQKQRDRTLALLEEKDLEVSTLKCSFQALVPGHRDPQKERKMVAERSQLSAVLDGNVLLESGGSRAPHILHYSHELARRDVQMTSLRKSCAQLEANLRQMNKDMIVQRQNHAEQVETLNREIDALRRCQSREGANLEYLKNVVLNYILSKDAGSKRHMFNAIAAVLRFTQSEIALIRNNI